MPKTLTDLLEKRSHESVERINALAKALAQSTPMNENTNQICPSCKNGIMLTNLKDISPFRCHCCGTKLGLILDELSTQGITQPYLQIIEK